MNRNPDDEIANAARGYAIARLKAERSRDPEAKKKIKEAERLLKKAESEADKTIDPKLKSKSDELFRKLQALWHKQE